MTNLWTNWAGNLNCAPRSIVVPHDRGSTIAAVREGIRNGAPLRVCGAAHSFTPIVPTKGTLLSLERLAGVLDVDAEVRRRFDPDGVYLTPPLRSLFEA